MYRWGPPLPPTGDHIHTPRSRFGAKTLDFQSLNLPFPILYSFFSDLVLKLLIGTVKFGPLGPSWSLEP